jgi:peptide/nickel transport system substrate-binding protein
MTRLEPPRPVVGAVAVAALALAGCNARPSPPERELRVAVAEDLASFDPHAQNTVLAYQILSSVYEPLVRLDRSMRPVPALAISWENPDLLTWVFRLRPGVRFHDGSPLSAEDVAASLRRLLEDQSLGMRSYLSGVVEVSARGTDAVVVRTDRPNAQLGSRLHFVLIVPRGSTSETLARRANGTGPYAVAGWTPPSLTLQRNLAYWGEPPGLARVRIDMGMTSEAAAQAVAEGRYDVVDVARKTEDAARRSGRYRMVEQENIFLRHLAFDVAQERTPFCPGIANPFRKPEVREAVSLALDRTRLAATAGPGAHPAYQLVPQSVFGHDTHLPRIEPDPARARALLARAGYPRGFDVVLHRGGFAAAAGLVRDQLSEIGIRVRVEAMPAGQLFAALERHRLSFWMLASGCATGDGLELLEGSFHSPGPDGLGVHNYSGYRNLELDREILGAGTLFDLQARQAAVQRLLKRVLDDRPWIPLYHDRGAVAVAKGLRYEPRADGYLWVAGVRLEPIASPGEPPAR